MMLRRAGIARWLTITRFGADAGDAQFAIWSEALGSDRVCCYRDSAERCGVVRLPDSRSQGITRRPDGGASV